MRVLLAPDKFKGSLTAADVARHLGTGMLAGRPELELTAVPIADGGDGTVDAAVAAGYQRCPVTVSGPTGEPVDTAFALLGTRAVVELADACGLVRLPGGVLAPMTASSAGLGQALLAAVRAGATTVVLGIGGSASTDGGAGLLSALGAAILDETDRPVDPGGGPLARAHRIDLSGLDPAIRSVEILLAADVDSPLLGPTGAAAVFAPQKGASPAQVSALDAALAHWADMVQRQVPGRWAELPGAGAAGGVGFAALAVLGARSRPGIELVLDLADFAGRLPQADVVITGEGSIDAQTLQGKGPAGVAAAAAALGVPVLAVAGRVLLDASQLRTAGFAATYALLDLEPDPARCMANAGPLLEQLGRRIGRELIPGRW
jgi:glycerate kinase